VVLKQEPLGSVRGEFLIDGRVFNSWEEICSREELGRKSCGWNKLVILITLIYSSHKN